jgi:mevalonate kinase
MGLSVYLEERDLFDVKTRGSFKNAVESGLSFNSNIPQGYGVGSSGAVCAAVYEQFLAATEDLNDVKISRESMAAMEGYFHGQSSGMDPLVSLKGAPILRESGNYHLLPPLKWPDGIVPFLLDSGTARRTGDLVQAYHVLTRNKDFRLSCLQPLVQSVDHAISFFIDAHISAFREHLQLISQLQLQYFTQMIPPAVLEIWRQTATSEQICIKLCGAGGGGFFLGFAKTEQDFIEFDNGCSLEVYRL